MKNNENKEICKKCGGLCCKKMPGIFSPSQFKKTMFDSLIKGFESKNLAIDWYEESPFDSENDQIDQVCFIRPRIENHNNLFDPAWGGECSLLTKNGCKLNFKKRPHQCQSLVPFEKLCFSENSKITNKFDKAYYAKKWFPYQEIILAAAKEAEDAK